MKFFILLLLCILTLHADMDSLLSALAQKDDLSQETKKESAGYLTVYTRADLDQMRITSLKEIIDQVPFLRYNENRVGLTEPLYFPYQPAETNTINVYIDDRELLSPYNGNGLQAFSQFSLEYIDHIEIYMGIPSQDFGLDPAVVTIKCYTKDPKREETNVIGANGGSRKTNNIYGYSAHSYKGYEYLVSVSQNNIKREKEYYQNNELSRDEKLYNLYAKVIKNNFKVDVQLARTSMDTFMGNGYSIDPLNPHVTVNYAHIATTYDNKDIGVKAYLSYTQDHPESWDASKTVLGSYQIPVFPYVQTYQNAYINMKEHLYNAKLFKKFKTQKNTLMLGFQGRIKQFDLKEVRLDNVIMPNNSDYNKESIVALSAEDQYLFNRSNMLTASILHKKYFENSAVQNYKTTSGRLGYIYHNRTITSKSYIFFGEVVPSMQVLYNNRAIFKQTTDPQKMKEKAYSTKLTYRAQNYKTSLLYGHTVIKNSIYFTGSSYSNLNKEAIFDTFSYDFTYTFNAQNRLLFNFYWNLENYKYQVTDPKVHKRGGYITFFNTVNKFKFYNNLVYKEGYSGLKEGFNYNATLNYEYSRNLELYLKGLNIFGTALKSNYYTINPLTGTQENLRNVDVIDQTFLLGLEYQF